MGQCIYCNKKGFFLSVSKNRLCDSCEAKIVLDLQQRGRIINDCLRLIEESKKLKTRLSRCHVLVEQANALYEYEKRKIPTISPVPSALIAKYSTRHDQIAIESMEEELEKVISKTELLSGHKAKIKEITKVLYEIMEIKKELNNKSLFNELEKRTNNYLHKLQLNEYFEEAKKAEFKGNKKKALDQYQEALYFLKNDKIDDDQQNEEITMTERKIAELQK